MKKGRLILREFIMDAITYYFVAFGVIIGGSVLGGMGAFLVGKPPLFEMVHLANNLKIWAIVATIGGTFDAINNFERGYLEGSMVDIIKQVALVITALIGARTGIIIIKWLTQESFH
jgi:hypothetical protein